MEKRIIPGENWPHIEKDDASKSSAQGDFSILAWKYFKSTFKPMKSLEFLFLKMNWLLNIFEEIATFWKSAIIFLGNIFNKTDKAVSKGYA